MVCRHIILITLRLFTIVAVVKALNSLEFCPTYSLDLSTYGQIPGQSRESLDNWQL